MSVGFHMGAHEVRNTKIFLSKVMGQRGYLFLGLFKSRRIITPKCLCNSVLLFRIMDSDQNKYVWVRIEANNFSYWEISSISIGTLSSSLLYLHFLEKNECLKKHLYYEWRKGKKGRNEETGKILQQWVKVLEKRNGALGIKCSFHLGTGCKLSRRWWQNNTDISSLVPWSSILKDKTDSYNVRAVSRMWTKYYGNRAKEVFRVSSWYY